MEKIPLKNGLLVFQAHFLAPEEADSLFTHLLATTQWEQHYIKLFGKKLAIPRLTAWHAEMDLGYKYSGIQVCPKPWTPALLDIKNKLEKQFSTTFNSVLINRYRSGQDSVEWHADDEAVLGENPQIGSISLGVDRRFQLKHIDDTDERYDIVLNHGSALLMGGSTQHYWQHKLPKSRKLVGERINLTFRRIEV